MFEQLIDRMIESDRVLPATKIALRVVKEHLDGLDQEEHDAVAERPVKMDNGELGDMIDRLQEAVNRFPKRLHYFASLLEIARQLAQAEL